MTVIKNPQPGDIISVIFPKHTGNKQEPMRALLIEKCPEVFHGLSAYAVTRIYDTLPKQIARKPQKQLMMRAQGKIFPLNREGIETINLTNITVLPLVPQFFPDLKQPAKDEASFTYDVLGSIAPDWIGLIHERKPQKDAWDWRAIDSSFSPEGFQNAADEVERQFRNLGRKNDDGTERPGGLYGFIKPNQSDYD